MHETSDILNVTALTFGLLFIAAMVSIATKRIRVPFTVALVLLGLAIGVAAQTVGAGHGTMAGVAAAIREIELTPDLILFIFLPTLLFESAYNLDVRQLTKDLGPILTFAVVGLVASTAIVGGLMAFGLELSLTHALLFGALISATDPVAVIALFKEIGTSKRLVTLVEGESLFNDATAIVLFSVVLGLIQGAVASPALALGKFVYVFLGGIAVGVILGVLFSKIIGRVRNDELVEITLTTVLAYGSFIVAEHLLHVSGVMSTVAAGMTVGSYGRTKISPTVLEFMHRFWAYLAYAANALIFLLVGLYLPGTLGTQDLGRLAWPVGLAILATLFARGAVVFGLVPLLRAARLTEPIDMKHQAVIYWGGLRGAIALALALSLIGRSDLPADLPTQILTLTAGVVLFTMLVNATTMRPLVRACGLDKETQAEALLRAQSMVSVQHEVETHFERLRGEALLRPRIVEGFLKAARDKRERLRASLADDATLPEQQVLNIRRIQYLGRERNHYLHLFAEGHLSEAATRELAGEALVTADRLRKGRVVTRAESSRSVGFDLLVRMLRVLPGFGGLAQHLQTRRVAEVYEQARGRFLAAREVVARLEQDHAAGALDAHSLEVLAGEWRERGQRAEAEMDEVAAQFPEYVGKVQELLASRVVLNTEGHAYQRLLEQGILTEQVYERLKTDLEERLETLASQPVPALDLTPRALLSAVPLFGGLRPEELDEVAGRLRSRACLRGETLFREGERGDRMFVIGRGVIRVWRGQGAERKPVATLTAGEFVGEMALLHPAPRTASAETATVATLLELAKPDLDQVIARFPRVGQALERAYQERIAQLRSGDAPRPDATPPER